jgi:hypothetical protein
MVVCSSSAISVSSLPSGHGKVSPDPILAVQHTD